MSIEADAEQIIRLAPPAFASDQDWNKPDATWVAQHVKGSLAQLTDHSLLLLFRRLCPYFPRRWKDTLFPRTWERTLGFDELVLLGSPPVEIDDTGSPMDDFTRMVLEMVLVILWAHKAIRGQTSHPDALMLFAFARRPRLELLLSHISIKLQSSSLGLGSPPSIP